MHKQKDKIHSSQSTVKSIEQKSVSTANSLKKLYNTKGLLITQPKMKIQLP